jgi:two-component system cell cycle sensor histidine kinase/response regulator CckA
MRLPFLARRASAATRLTQALLDHGCLALLDGAGNVIQHGEGFLAAAKGQALALAEPALSRVKAAAAEQEPLDLAAETPSGIPLALSLRPTGRASPAAILRATGMARERALEQQLEQAQRLQSVGQLAGGIAHDFNNLLTAIIASADELLASEGTETNPELAQIRASAQRGAALVRQLLAFGGRQILRPRLVALSQAVEDAAGLIGRLLGKDIHLDLALEQPSRLVRVDQTQLDQVLLNLAVNARDAMKPGGTLTIATGHRMVLEPVTEGPEHIPPGRYATLSVSDTGAGIPPDVLPRIFEPFFTTKKTTGGTGLGLATVLGIVRQSGGYLTVRSAPGQGTCFTILLPRVAGLPPTQEKLPAAIDAAKAATPVSPQAQARSLLLVEDEAPIRLLTARALRRAGWHVTESPSADEALTLSLENLACVVSDVSMPGLDGVSFVRQLRQRLPGLPAVLMSGYADQVQREALAAEHMLFLAKPFAMADLVRAAESACQAAS